MLNNTVHIIVISDYMHSIYAHIILTTFPKIHLTELEVKSEMGSWKYSFFPCCKSLGYEFQRSLLDTNSNPLSSVAPKSLTLHHLSPLPPVHALVPCCLFHLWFLFSHRQLQSVSTEFSRICSNP